MVKMGLTSALALLLAGAGFAQDAEQSAEVKQTPEGAHRFLALLAEQGGLMIYYHYRAWPAYNLSYKVTGVQAAGACRTVMTGTADTVQLAGWPMYRAGSPQMAYGMKEFAERYKHTPPPIAIDWSKVTSVTLSGPTAASPNDVLTVLVTSGNQEVPLRLTDQALAKRVSYAAEFLKAACDKTAETGF